MRCRVGGQGVEGELSSNTASLSLVPLPFTRCFVSLPPTCSDGPVAERFAPRKASVFSPGAVISSFRDFGPGITNLQYHREHGSLTGLLGPGPLSATISAYSICGCRTRRMFRFLELVFHPSVQLDTGGA